MTESQVLRRLDYPAYCIKLLDNGLVAMAGGGGTAKTGVGNSLELGFISYKNNLAEFKQIHQFQSDDAIMKFVPFYLERHNLKKESKINDIYIAAALNQSVEIYKIQSCLKKLENKSKPQFEAGADVQFVSRIALDQTEDKENSITTIQVYRHGKKVYLIIGTTLGSILIYNLLVDNNNNITNTHSNEIDELQVNGDGVLLSVGKDSKCFIWSLDKLEKIDDDTNLRIKHIRFSNDSKFMYLSYIPRIRGGNKSMNSYIQKWVRVKDTLKEEVEKTVKVRNTILTCLQTSKDGYFVCAGDCEGKVYLYDHEMKRPEDFKKQHSSVITDLCFYYDEVFDRFLDMINCELNSSMSIVRLSMNLFKFFFLLFFYSHRNLKNLIYHQCFCQLKSKQINEIILKLLVRLVLFNYCSYCPLKNAVHLTLMLMIPLMRYSVLKIEFLKMLEGISKKMSHKSYDINEPVDFTLNIIEKGDSNIIVEESEYFTLEITRLFDDSVLKALGYDLDNLIGFILNKSEYATTVRQRLGFFNSLLNEIIHRAVYKMKLNELSELSFEINPDIFDESFAFKNKHHSQNVVFLDLKFKLRVIDVEKLKPYECVIYKNDENHLFNFCQEHKNDANELFKKSHIYSAFKRYHKSISYLIIADQLINDKISQKDSNEMSESCEDEMIQKLNDLKKQIKEQKAILYSNLAMCQLKSCNYEMAIVNCSMCLEIDRNNVKALYRRAQARTGRNDYDDALQDYMAALKLDSNNQEIKNKIAQLSKVYELKILLPLLPKDFHSPFLS
ncbi:70 kDa peptidyl-prolyl isomerase [Brachionus plicatilis]|uniref:70 kDa peptidyl-prolyl isomerase n=1 Tax=Brachionus plicatilis TaxID=10195 RepID=A0A3M7T0Q4_BRAPC|nr:70 kDa peptidyl-prolyl isomerase [Brachionus plicatilis]